jgi:hypothetical protein
MAWVQALGMQPVDMKDVNRSDRGPASAVETFLKSKGGSPSGPLDLLFFFLIFSWLQGLKAEKNQCRRYAQNQAKHE